MISACFLERKYGGSLFFPHRSFQEFLVAEHVLLRVRQLDIDLRDLSRVVKPEIGEFITQLAQPDDFQKFSSALRRFAGEVSLSLLLAWMRDTDIATALLKALTTSDSSQWSIVLGAVAVIGGSTDVNAKDFLDMLEKRARVFQPRTRLVAMLAAMAVTEETNEDVGDGFVGFLIAMFEAAVDDYMENRRVKRRSAVAIEDFLRLDLAELNVFQAIEIESRDKYPSVTLDVRRAFAMLVRSLRHEVMVEEWADAAESVQAGSLARLELRVTLSKQTITEAQLADGKSFLIAMGARIRT
jgi:hypothetical protein